MIHRKINQYLKEIRVRIGLMMYDKKKQKQTIDMSKMKKVIFLVYRDKIGDSIVNTIMYRELKKKYPDIYISVLTGMSSKKIIENNININKIYLWDKNNVFLQNNILKQIKNEAYDILINIDDLIFFKSMKIVYTIGAIINIGIDKNVTKIYDYSIDKMIYPYHESDKCKKVLGLFEVENPEMKYDIVLSDEEINKAELFYSEKKGKRICINLFGANKHRTLSIKNGIEIIKKLMMLEKQCSIVLISQPSFRKTIQKLAKRINLENIYIADYIQSIRDSSAIIKVSDIIISPETSIVHIASVFEKKQIAIYRDQGSKNVWAPISKNAKIIVSNSKRDVNSFDIENFLDSYKCLIRE